MLKAVNLIRQCSRDLHGQPLVHFYQQIMLNTQSTVLQNLLIQMFEANQWELPERFQTKKVWTDSDDI
ncbi:hypothetical protein GZ77_00225 [Endozoicomonas montiporae]|uniref:Uncharacterized protein n=2 Tax=Endozoicomonas montiporae TaxID=1027273 RepID=A0A081N9P2_9GAMM|nr:hypothetical protein [Endozoicomonas montiporae]AMO55019.1 hypothetical protein EZMO1_0794 [Endozoicomonas montiporae CL-33]KEQ15165.1 hypothetical protein GZ77_00225 [Endozoicomonas montiporae]